MKKLYPLILIAVFVLAAFIPFVSASYVCPAACYYSGTTFTVQLRHAMPSVLYPSATGDAFTANATCYLYNATFHIWTGAGTYTFCSRLYAVQGGTVGNDAYPTNTILAQSETYDSTILSGTPTDFTCNFNGTYQIQSGQNYVIDLEILTYTSGTLQAHQGASSGSINGVIHQSGAWTTYAGKDMYFIINGDSASLTPTPTPTPSPTPVGWTPTPAPNNVTSVIDAIIANINVLIFLAVIFIFGVLGYGFAGAWGFFAGVNLAVVMLVIFGTLPLWVAIAMIVLDGLMFFGKAEIGKGNKKED